MNNKETLQQYNNRLETNNNNLDSIIEIVNNLPEADKPVNPIIPDYITNGLIAWFDGEDKPHNDKYWINKLGIDYIFDMNGKSLINEDKSYKNDKTLVMKTSDDYMKQGYTIEVVGKINSQTNSDSTTSGGWFFTMNESTSLGIGVSKEPGTLAFVNSTQYTAEKSYNNCYQKRIGASLFLETISARGTGKSNTVKVSVNGCEWYSIYEPNDTVGVTLDKHAILCYYARTDNATYSADGEINCIRIYNRQLTNEELVHNHNIDKERFGIDIL